MSGMGKRPYFHTLTDQLQNYSNNYKIISLNAVENDEIEKILSTLEKNF